MVDMGQSHIIRREEEPGAFFGGHTAGGLTD